MSVTFGRVAGSMDVFHFFKVLLMVPNHAKRLPRFSLINTKINQWQSKKYMEQ